MIILIFSVPELRVERVNKTFIYENFLEMHFIAK